LLGQIPNGVHAESLFVHLINVAIAEKYLAQQLGLVVSTNDEIVVQSPVRKLVTSKQQVKPSSSD